ncbi:hypothetical protein BC830DRAFT_1175724, partial [Chytriomyces sp. MP71]
MQRPLRILSRCLSSGPNPLPSSTSPATSNQPVKRKGPTPLSHAAKAELRKVHFDRTSAQARKRLESAGIAVTVRRMPSVVVKKDATADPNSSKPRKGPLEP